MKKLYITLVAISVILGAFTLFYFHYISPAFVAKPNIAKPVGSSLNHDLEMKGGSQTNIQEKQVQYIANEVGAYKLHSDPLSNDKAVVEFQLTDIHKKFYITVVDNYPTVSNEKVADPDITLYTTQDIMSELINSTDFNKDIVRLVSEGKIRIDINTDEKTLAMKGYKAIYDSMMASSPTGQFAREFNEKVVWLR